MRVAPLGTADDPHDRPRGLRLLAGAAAIVLLCTAGACGASGARNPSAPGAGTPSASHSGSQTAPGAVSIPTGNLSAYDRCMLDLGATIIGVHSPGPGDAGPEYNFSRDTKGIDPKQAMAEWEKCTALLPSPIPLTDAEIRQIYDRWVGEYHCMVGLGYQPDAPPSVETFIATWKSTGPWMPLQGIHTEQWTQAQYDEAKATCTLDMFSDDRYQ